MSERCKGYGRYTVPCGRLTSHPSGFCYPHRPCFKCGRMFGYGAVAGVVVPTDKRRIGDEPFCRDCAAGAA